MVERARVQLYAEITVLSHLHHGMGVDAPVWPSGQNRSRGRAWRIRQGYEDRFTHGACGVNSGRAASGNAGRRATSGS